MKGLFSMGENIGYFHNEDMEVVTEEFYEGYFVQVTHFQYPCSVIVAKLHDKGRAMHMHEYVVDKFIKGPPNTLQDVITNEIVQRDVGLGRFKY